MEVVGYKTTHPVWLIWQDPLEVVMDIFSNPIFENHMTYNPHLVKQGEDQEYSEFFTVNC